MDSFKAYVIDKDAAGKVSGQLTTMSPEQLDGGEVTIRVAYSSVNYKDALAATGTGKIIRRFPCVGGIDMSGEVVSSTDARFHPGDKVIATSFDLGVAHHGGYAEFARVPADWVLPLPDGLDLKEAMALGTAGLTAALAILRMEHDGLAPQNGPVVVTGATGGVRRTCRRYAGATGVPHCGTHGKATAEEYLRGLGASEVKLTSTIDFAKVRPLDSAQWAGAIGQRRRQIPALDSRHHEASRNGREYRQRGGFQARDHRCFRLSSAASACWASIPATLQWASASARGNAWHPI